MNEVPNRAGHADRQILPDPNSSLHEVQVRKDKGKWTTRYSFQGEGLKAAKYYSGVNVGSGYRKRFVVDGNVTHTTIGMD
jgi:hypothetical protein